MMRGIEAGIENVVHCVAGARLLAFCQRQGQQVKCGLSAGQGLLDPAGKLELRTACQNEQAVRPFCVHDHLDVGQKPRHMLHLVDDGTAIKPGQESPGIRLGELPLVQSLQVDVLQVREGSPAECRFPRLPGTGDGDNRVLLKGRLQVSSQVSFDHC